MAPETSPDGTNVELLGGRLLRLSPEAPLDERIGRTAGPPARRHLGPPAAAAAVSAVAQPRARAVRTATAGAPRGLHAVPRAAAAAGQGRSCAAGLRPDAPRRRTAPRRGCASCATRSARTVDVTDGLPHRSSAPSRRRAPGYERCARRMSTVVERPTGHLGSPGRCWTAHRCWAGAAPRSSSARLSTGTRSTSTAVHDLLLHAGRHPGRGMLRAAIGDAADGAGTDRVAGEDALLDAFREIGVIGVRVQRRLCALGDGSYAYPDFLFRAERLIVEADPRSPPTTGRRATAATAAGIACSSAWRTWTRCASATRTCAIREPARGGGGSPDVDPGCVPHRYV